MKDKITHLKEGLKTAFIDSSVSSYLAYKPQFVSNNYKEGKKVISSIEKELLICQEFFISVAFITMSGLTPLLQTLKELEEREIPGRVLTTDYLSFSEPRALEKLFKFKNLSLKIYSTKEAREGFHTKGYIFKKEEEYRIIVGSSNMTLNALTKNKEWNTRIVSTDQGEYANEIIAEFEEMWNSSAAKDYKAYIQSYSKLYHLMKKQRRIAKQLHVTSLDAYKLKPNSMQLGFISNLRKIQQAGENRALLISATGTGKTFASAFATREMNPKKVLFLVHREQIAKQAIRSFRKVFGDTKNFGLLSGNGKDYDAEFLFSTMQMMAKVETLLRFQKDEFQMIIIDEAHRVGAKSYQKIIDYFEPDFWLGMTASPERTDGFDVYKAFDHNIAYEIRLQQALEEEMLCPFHYFGITDLQIDGESFDEELSLKDFNKLTSDDRINYVIEQMQYYGYSGERVRGLVFCSSKKEAIVFSEKFNQRGYCTAVLTGDDGQERREETIEKLVAHEGEILDYIFTVDIFNEGVDIPEINQIVMLRPTESPIVFVQQLGRGLRKADNKEYVVVLDFIGNYKNNFMIPIALSGDRSYNKDSIRKYVLEGERMIPGSSTIHFDEIARKNIFSSIDAANFSDISLIKESYKNLKNKVGRIPTLQDFDQYGEIDVMRIFDNSRLGSYYKFLVKYEKEYTVRLSDKEEKVIEFVSKKIVSGKRIHELKLFDRMLHYRDKLMENLEKTLQQEYSIKLQENTKKNIVNVLTNTFPSGAGRKTYSGCVFVKKDEQTADYCNTNEFENMKKNPDFYNIFKELIEYGITRYNEIYSNRYKDTNFVLYKKYTYEEVCRLLDWESNEVPLNIGANYIKIK